MCFLMLHLMTDNNDVQYCIMNWLIGIVHNCLLKCDKTTSKEGIAIMRLEVKAKASNQFSRVNNFRLRPLWAIL